MFTGLITDVGEVTEESGRPLYVAHEIRAPARRYRLIDLL